MDALRANGIPFVVAPLEADAQVPYEPSAKSGLLLAQRLSDSIPRVAPLFLLRFFRQLVWLCKTGAASAIVMEDSDVFLYCMASGVDAPVLFKLDDSGVVQVRHE